jgi:hypothetical protein
MQKVEGSSPFSRSHKSPANARFFVSSLSGGATVTMQKVEDSNPASRGANTPYLLAFQDLGRPSPRPDGRSVESVPDSFRKLEPGAGSPLHAHRGSITPRASSRTSLKPYPIRNDEAHSHRPKVGRQFQPAKPRPRSRGPGGLSGSSSSETGARSAVVGVLLEPSRLQEFCKPVGRRSRASRALGEAHRRHRDA